MGDTTTATTDLWTELVDLYAAERDAAPDGRCRDCAKPPTATDPVCRDSIHPPMPRSDR